MLCCQWGFPGKNTGCCSMFSPVRLFVTPWTAACQAPLSFTISLTLLKHMSIESGMLSNHHVLCCPRLLLPSVFPSLRVFFSQLSTSGGQNLGVSASASDIPMDIQDWFLLGLTGLILQSKGLSRDYPTSQFKSINSSTLTLLYGPTITSLHDCWKNHSFA